MKINKLSLTIVLILIFIMVLWFVQNQSKQESDGVQLSQDEFEQSLPQPEGDNLKFVYELRKNHADQFAGAYLVSALTYFVGVVITVIDVSVCTSGMSVA